MKNMEELQNEFLELQNLGLDALDDAQRDRFYELPNLIIETAKAEKTVSEEIKKNLDSALAQKEHFRTKLEKEEAERKALEVKLNQDTSKMSLEVNDFIDISASLDGLDQREKEYLAKQHKMTGKPLSEIRKDEDFVLWQDSYRQKVEKEKLSIKPSSKQSDSDSPISLEEALANATTMDEKQKILEAAVPDYSLQNKQRTDTVYRR
jgi:predicted nucleic acid-binding protein